MRELKFDLVDRTAHWVRIPWLHAILHGLQRIAAFSEQALRPLALVSAFAAIIWIAATLQSIWKTYRVGAAFCATGQYTQNHRCDGLMADLSCQYEKHISADCPGVKPYSAPRQDWLEPIVDRHPPNYRGMIVPGPAKEPATAEAS